MSKLNSQAFDISLDDEGYLLTLDRWNESVAVELASRENIKLTEAHWEIIRLIGREKPNDTPKHPMFKVCLWARLTCMLLEQKSGGGGLR